MTILGFVSAFIVRAFVHAIMDGQREIAVLWGIAVIWTAWAPLILRDFGWTKGGR